MENKTIRRIGVLTSGGDAPGMNAVIRAVVRTASANNISVLGIRRGYSGLINGDIIEMAARSVDGIIRKGGTMLYTARCQEMLTEEGLQKAADTCKYLGIDGLICIGGDGTFRGAQALSRKGVPCIGVPGTIDNDIGCSEYLAERRNQYLLGFFNMIVVYGIFKTESKRKSVPESFIYQRISDGYSVGRTIE